MAEGLGQVGIISASSGPDVELNDVTLENVQRLEFDFSRSILIIQQANPSKRVELQYDNLNTVTWTPAANIVSISRA